MPIITKKYKFCAAHRYHHPEWTDEKNMTVFGDDWKIHGHNYIVEISIKGPIQSETGFVVNLQKINTLVQENVINILDHSDIGNDIPWFRNKQPSSENLSVYIWELLEDKILKPAKLFRVKIRETPSIYSEYFGKEE